MELLHGEEAFVHTRGNGIVGHQYFTDQKVSLLCMRVSVSPPIGWLEAEIIQLIDIPPTDKVGPLPLVLYGADKCRLIARCAFVRYKCVKEF